MKMRSCGLRSLSVAVCWGLGVAAATTGCNALKPSKPDVAALRKSHPAPVRPGHAGPPGHQHLLREPSRLSPEERKEVVARIGKDIVITLGDVERRLDSMPAYVRLRYATLEKKREFLDDMVRFELMALDARAKGYDRDPDVVYAMKEAMVKKLLAEDLSRLVSPSDITDDEIRRYYEENRDLYHKPAMRRVSMVVLADEATARQVHKGLLEAFAKAPRRKRQAFLEAVQKFSVDEASRRRNGDSGFFDAHGKPEDSAHKGVPEAVAKAAFALSKINDVSDPLTDGKRWYVVLLTNIRPAVDRSLDQVKRQIRNKLYRQRREEARKKYIASLRDKYPIELHEELLALVKTQPPRPPEIPKELQRESAAKPGAHHGEHEHEDEHEHHHEHESPGAHGGGGHR